MQVNGHGMAALTFFSVPKINNLFFCSENKRKKKAALLFKKPKKNRRTKRSESFVAYEISPNRRLLTVAYLRSLLVDPGCRIYIDCSFDGSIVFGGMSCFTVCCSRDKASPPEQTTDINEDIFSSVQDAKLYSYKELLVATQNFNVANKIGEGGFGSVYKGRLKDNTLVAVKVLSAQSEQGAMEFLNEIVAISGLEHENLVKLYGCCTEGQRRMLVYGYLENNSLARYLVGGRYRSVKFSWKIRSQICIGVARGLTFLHEEVQPHIVHRDIKASNVLLDKDFTAKISDFGLAKLFPATATHVSTRVAGTLGYLAPEYAIRGKLTRKADVYSFGVLLMEIVSGRSHRDQRLQDESQFLLEMAWALYEKGTLVQLVDGTLEGDANIDEACKYLKIALLCTQVNPKIRPSMSTVVKMLRGEAEVEEGELSKPGLLTELRRPSNEPRGSSSSAGTSSTSNTNASHGTMTFTSIYDRSN